MNRKFEEEVAVLANNDENTTMGTTEYLRDKFVREGKEEGIEQSVANILLTRNFSNTEIAEMLRVPISLVETVRAKLNTKK